MKKWIWIIVAIILVIAIGVGAYFLFAPKKDESETESGLVVHSEVTLFDETQYENESAVIRVLAIGEEFTAITYQIDNDEEVTMTAKTGASTEYEDMRYIDTRNTLIDLTGVEAGDHILKIKVYNGENSEVIYKVTFEIKRATTTA